ncbi:MAG: ABC transporter substrate-binding protein [Candidatus Izemoplasmatales bacterium]|jgi:peptide/nickel transport system substrate-binding protein|nr:ABC transporter substrate-binding protein [Candidatus Izemoplasmatales bacterium]
MLKKIMSLTLIFISLFLVGCSSNEYERRDDASNTLYVGSVGASFPTSFMPWLSRDGIAPTIASMVYNTLFSYDDQTGEFVESIGKEWYYVSPEGEPILTTEGKIDYDELEEVYSGSEESYLVVKIIIHDDIFWHDGEKLTVEDIYYTFDIGTNNALSNHAGSLAWTADLQHSYSNGVMTKQGIFTYDHGANERGYEITEEEKDTVMYLHVNKVLGAITSLFSTILILPEHIWKPIVTVDNQLNSKNPSEETLYQYQNPVGSGGYKLDPENSNAQVITLVRNDDYHLKDGLDYLYKVEKIKFMLFQEQNVAIYALLKGHIDILDSTVSSNYLSLFEDREDIYVSNADGIFTQTLVINLNPATSEKNDLRDLLGISDFRRAIALAINQEELVSFVLNGAGKTVSAGLLSESLTDFYNPDADILRFDLEERITEANLLLDNIVPEKDSEGYRLLDGNRIKYTILGTPGEQDVISRLQVQLQRIGIEVEYKAKGSSPERTYIFNSKFDMTLQGVIFSLENADIMYRAHFVTLSQSSNYGRLTDSLLSSKINEMRLSLNLNYKYELLQEIQELIALNYYKIPLYTSNIISVARTDRYEGYVVVEGSTIFNTDTLQNLRRVEG